MKRIAAYAIGYVHYYYLWTVWYIETAVARIWVRLTGPWWLARFNAAWPEYRVGPVYRERVVVLGLDYAINRFIESRWERDYCLKLRCRKEKWLRLKLIFTPFNFEKIPEDLMIAARQGYFNNKK